MEIWTVGSVAAGYQLQNNRCDLLVTFAIIGYAHVSDMPLIAKIMQQ